VDRRHDLVGGALHDPAGDLQALRPSGLSAGDRRRRWSCQLDLSFGLVEAERAVQVDGGPVGFGHEVLLSICS
jgi:hypothetical protein